MTCLEIECLVAQKYNVRQHIIVPNVSWGLFLHECDMLILSKSGYATEIEIKISKADLKKDIKKTHNHVSKKIKYLYFAITEKLESCVDLIPAHAGIYIMRKYPNPKDGHYAQMVRFAEPNKDCRPFTQDEINLLTKLGTMRIWALKNAIVGLIKTNNNLRERVKLIESKN